MRLCLTFARLSSTTRDVSDIRSLLFAPAGQEQKLVDAIASEADGVVADLEDSVPPADKAAARHIVARIRPRIVRVNGADTAWFDDDLALVGELSLDAVVLPKATPDAAAALGPDGPPVIAIIETAQGLRLAFETACSPRVAALVLGVNDFSADVGLEPLPDRTEVLYARSKVVVDSVAAGIRRPFDIVFREVDDDAGLEASSRFGRSLGFRGKVCIHPRQTPIVNRVFDLNGGGS